MTRSERREQKPGGKVPPQAARQAPALRRGGRESGFSGIDQRPETGGRLRRVRSLGGKFGAEPSSGLLRSAGIEPDV